jgi:membrane protein DedA with SNARE-associated domain
MSTYALAGKWIRDIKQAAMRMKFVGQLIWEIRVQLLMLATISLLVVLGNLGLIPSPIDIAAYISDAFDRFGLPAIAMCSFLENIVGFNVYFPGSIVILSGMAWTAGNPLLALKVYLAIVAPAMLAQHVNYLAGRATADTARARASEATATGRSMACTRSPSTWPICAASAAARDRAI